MELNKDFFIHNRGLWNKFISGDDNAFVQIYNDNVDALFNYGLHFTPLHDQIRDAIQDVFTQIYAKRNSLGKVENVRFYLLKSFKNALYAIYNNDSRLYQIDTVDPFFYFESSVEDVYIGRESEDELKLHIYKMIQALTPRQQEVIFYRFTEELSYEEICSIMQMNLQSVRNLLHRSIQKIREAYVDYYKLLRNKTL